MPTLVLASAFTRWLTDAATADGGSAAEQRLVLPAATVRELLEAAFVRHPRLRGYVLDEQGRLRHHVVVFVDGMALTDKARQSLALSESSQVHLLQALSGG